MIQQAANQKKVKAVNGSPAACAPEGQVCLSFGKQKGFSACAPALCTKGAACLHIRNVSNTMILRFCGEGAAFPALFCCIHLVHIKTAWRDSTR